MLELTTAARNESKKILIEPTVVFKIEGIDNIFTNVSVSELIRIGDPDLYIGNDWVIGGVRAIKGQHPYMMFNQGTTTKLNQKLSPDRAQGSTVTSLNVTLLDKNEQITELISPGFQLEDILGRNCFVKVGLKNTAYPRDYNLIFNGIISDVEPGPGYINFLLVNSEEKKRKPFFNRSTTETVNSIITGPLSSIQVIDGSLFPTPQLGPDNLFDDDIEYLCRIDDEIFKYTSGGSTISGITRAYLSTQEASHNSGANINFGIRLKGNGIDLALKMMCSGVNGYFATGIKIKHINKLSDNTPIQNCIFVESVNMIDDYGLTPGDYVTTTLCANGANNFSMRQIIDIDVTDDGSFIVVDGSNLTDEFGSTGELSFRSKYDSLGIGLGMSPMTVDVKRHEYIRDTFLNNYEFDFQGVFEISDSKIFIEQQIYLPMGCFSVPRSGKSSVTYTIGPIADTFIPTISVKNAKNPDRLKPKRSIASNFTNTIQYEFDHNTIENKYARVKTYSSTESLNRIPIGEKLLPIKSQGLRSSLNAVNLSILASNRMLDRYKFGAEVIPGMQVLFSDGFPMEIGDIVMVDYGSLKMSDIAKGSRSGDIKFMEVINKTYDLKSGDVQVDVLNTSFELNDRFGLISPSSKIGPGSTTTKLNLKKSWSTKAYQLETRKWIDHVAQKVIIHSPDWSVQEETTIISLNNNPEAMLVNPPLSFTPAEDYIIDIPYYPDSVDPNINAQYKGMYFFFSPNVEIVAGISQLIFEVSPSDISKFQVGAIVRINNFDYSNYSPEAEVISVNTILNRVEIDTPSGFTINNTHECKLIGFKDGGFSYRWI